MVMLEQLYDVCQDNGFDEINLDGGVLNCRICSFDDLRRYLATGREPDNGYRLEAVGLDGALELTLESCLPIPVTPEALAFLRNHGETAYPLRRTVRSAGEMQDALDSLQSAADDLFGFCRDIAEKRHTPESAEAALAYNFSLRDTPQEAARLDSRAIDLMLAKRTLWHLSAGNDFRDLVSDTGEHPETDIRPELFVHTASTPGFDPDVPGKVYEDRGISVTLHKEEEFDRLTVPGLSGKDAGRIILYQAEIVFPRSGTVRCPLIHAVCPDDWFAAGFLIPNRIPAETVFLSGSENGWLSSVLKILHTRHILKK